MDKLTFIFVCTYAIFRCFVVRGITRRDRKDRSERMMLSFFFQSRTPAGNVQCRTHAKSNNFFPVHTLTGVVPRWIALQPPRQCSARFSRVCRYAAYQQRYEHRGYCFLDIAFGMALIGRFCSEINCS